MPTGPSLTRAGASPAAGGRPAAPHLFARLASSSTIAAQTMATWLTLVATVLLLFAARAVLAQALGPERLGLYTLMLTAGWLAGTVLSVGLPAYNASFAGKQRPSVLLANSLAWNLASLVVLTAICAPILAWAGVSRTASVILVGVLMAPFLAMLECTRGILQGQNAIAPYNTLGLLAGALNLFVIGGLAATSRLTIAGAVACWIGSTMVTAVGSVGVVARSAGGFARVDPRLLAKSFRFGGQAWLTQLAGIVNLRIGIVLTQGLLGTTAVGIYAIAVTVAEALFYFPNALAVVTSARYAAADAASARLLLLRSSAWVLACSLASALALFLVGGPVIVRVFGPAYATSASILMVLLPGVVVFTPGAVSIWYFNAHVRRPVINFIVAAFSAVINGTLILWWAPSHGLRGVAWATTTAFAAASVLNAIFVARAWGRKENSASVGKAGITRWWWRALDLMDLAVAVPIYLVVPHQVRARWSAPGTVLRNRRGYEEVLRLIEGAPHPRVLDVGGGIAALDDVLGGDSRVSVVTLDLDMEMLGRARRKVARAVLVCADGTRLPFADGTFDAVVMVHAFEHIPEAVRPELVAEIKRVSRRGVVIHGPAGESAVELTRQFIAAIERRGVEAPRYAREHLLFKMPMPDWFAEAFPGCRLQPRRNLNVELVTLLTAYTPIVRWLTGYRNWRLAAEDERPPFVEYTMTWRKPGTAGEDVS